MPELPEVETVRTGLAASIEGATIKCAQLRRAGLRVPFSEGFEERVAGRRILSISRRAKYLLFHLSGGQVILSHLGMSGRFSVLEKPLTRYEKHDHVLLHLSDGRVVVYNDARRFGVMVLAEKSTLDEHPLLAVLGPEPLEEGFSSAYLKKVLAKRGAPVKPVLMEQGVVVGVGNIYASEALFLAGIHPTTPAAEVAPKAALIVRCIRKVLRDAIASGGSSLHDFVQVTGETGYFQHHFNVYDRAGEPCFACSTPIASMRQSGRSTYFCPQCQG